MSMFLFCGFQQVDKCPLYLYSLWYWYCMALIWMCFRIWNDFILLGVLLLNEMGWHHTIFFYHVQWVSGLNRNIYVLWCWAMNFFCPIDWDCKDLFNDPLIDSEFLLLSCPIGQLGCWSYWSKLGHFSI